MSLKNIKLEVSYMSVIGKVRSHNEDNLFVNGHYLKQRETINKSTNTYYEGPFHLFGVFDGIGGESFGDLASSIASKGHEYIYHYLKNEPATESVQKIYNAYIDVINKRILKEKKKRAAEQMGTTLATLIFKDHQVYPFFLGDSRIYRYRDETLTQLSVDHTETAMLVRLGMLSEEEALAHPSHGKLRQFMGKDEDGLVLEADAHPEFDFRPGDSYLICSDGLSHALDSKALKSFLSSEESANKILDRLFNFALENKGDDNITGIVIKEAL